MRRLRRKHALLRPPRTLRTIATIAEAASKKAETGRNTLAWRRHKRRRAHRRGGIGTGNTPAGAVTPASLVSELDFGQFSLLGSSNIAGISHAAGIFTRSQAHPGPCENSPESLILGHFAHPPLQKLAKVQLRVSMRTPSSTWSWAASVGGQRVLTNAL